MKTKFIFMICVAACLGFCACSGNSKGGTPENDGQTTAAAPEEEAIITDAICMDAKGNISKIEETIEEGLFGSTTIYTFDEQGHLISREQLDCDDCNPDFELKRDSLSRPILLTLKETDDMGEEQNYCISFTYDSDNLLIKEEHGNEYADWTTNYTRDNEGKIIEMKVEDSLNETSTQSVTYPEDSFDINGNWIKRIFDGGGSKTTVTRKITYRQ